MSQPIPQGVEILIKKASVDTAFKKLLLERRGAAAATIGLVLEATEATMLAATPAAQLEAVIARTSVPQEHRRAFLGQAAAAMLAALGAFGSAAAGVEMQVDGGIRPNPPLPKKEKEPTVEERVIQIISQRTGVEAKRIKRDNRLGKDLGVKPARLVKLRKDLARTFNIKVPAADFKKIGTVGETIDYVENALKKKPAAESPPAPAAPPSPFMTRGIRADLPPLGTKGGTRPDLPPVRPADGTQPQ